MVQLDIAADYFVIDTDEVIHDVNYRFRNRMKAVYEKVLRNDKTRVALLSWYEFEEQKDAKFNFFG